MGKLQVRFVRYEGVNDVRMDEQERIDARMGKGPNRTNKPNKRKQRKQG